VVYAIRTAYTTTSPYLKRPLVSRIVVMNRSSIPTVNKSLGLIAALSTVVLWASAYPAIRIGLKGFDPFSLAALRFVVAGSVMVAWLVYARPKLPAPKDCAQLAFCAFIGITAYNLLLNAGQQSTSAAAASFIINTAPIMTSLMAVGFLNERFSPISWLGSVIGFVGVGIVASGQPGGLSFGGGSMLVFLAALCHALYFILQRPLLARVGVKYCAPMLVVLGAVFLLPWVPQAHSQIGAAPTSSIWAAIFLGIFPAAAGFFTWSFAQAHYGVARAANFLYLVPAVAATISYLVNAEVPSATTLIGGGIAIFGVVLVNAFKPTPTK
jgi:drug/metabolite transporter (DMT)-like permease